MRFTSSIATACTVAFAHAATIQNERRDAGLEVTLAPGEGSAADVVATIKNVGAESLNLLTLGTFLDSAPVQKLGVVDEANEPVKFIGIFRTIKYSSLHEQYFQHLEAGATFTTTVSPAAVHDLGTGVYTFSAEGAMPFALGNSTELSGSAVYFKSNDLTMNVDGAAVAQIKKAIPTRSLTERTVLQSGCTSAQKSSTTNALTKCASMAKAAAQAASSGSASKFSEYFKTTSSSTRSTVAARLNAVASQCGSLTSGSTKYYCADTYGYCEPNVLAYTIPSTNEIVNCPIYYSALSLITNTCHDQDQTTTTLHEMTHAPGAFSPGTDDYAYGYSASIALTTAKSVLNADSYALYANAINLGC
ncbi:Neutral protease 2 [Venustampulla echinocandica]|uniref:Neutral protease 2 n=1 Tax=Venustampulla echinocandica TaxID=2656787 RepID=A0A370TX83_9HELO|nr:Neutral protease 2 [Venustampulla echinocandica]RDL40146.1 Neutral protease 2 [Venustampulla echinocandica]